MGDSFQPDSFVADSFAPDEKPTYDKGFFKVYKGGAKTIPQKLDTAAGSVSDFVLNTLKLPYDLAGEAITAPIEQRGFRAPSLFGGENPADPIATANKLLRAGAAGMSTGNMDTARTAYNAPRGIMGPIEDTAMAALLGKVAPEVLTAPADAMAAATEKTLSAAKDVGSTVVKKGIQTMLGPTEEAQKVRFNRPEDVARQTDFSGLGDRLAEATNKLSDNLKELDNKAWDTLQNPSERSNVYFHGTNAPEAVLEKGFDTSKRAQAGSSYLGDNIAKGVYLSKDISPYREGGDLEDVSHVLRVPFEFKNPLKATYGDIVDLYDKAGIDKFDPRGPAKFTNWLKKQGYDALDLGKEVIALNPSELKAETINTVGKDELLKVLNDARLEFTGKGGSKIGSADKQAVAQIGKYIDRVSSLKSAPGALESNQIGQDQLKQIVQSIQKDARYDLPDSDPINRAVQTVRAGFDGLLKQNEDYKGAMQPVAEATSALKDTVKRFRLEYKTGEGYLPTQTTVSRLQSVLKDKNPEADRALEQLKNVTGIDFMDEAMLTAVKQTFAQGKTQGSRRVQMFKGAGAGAGLLLSKLLGVSPWGPAIAGGAAGAQLGGAADEYGGPMAAKVIDTLRQANSGVGNVISAINNKASGTPIEEVVKKLLAGQPAFAGLLQGNQ